MPLGKDVGVRLWISEVREMGKKGSTVRCWVLHFAGEFSVLLQLHSFHLFTFVLVSARSPGLRGPVVAWQEQGCPWPLIFFLLEDKHSRMLLSLLTWVSSLLTTLVAKERGIVFEELSTQIEGKWTFLTVSNGDWVCTRNYIIYAGPGQTETGKTLPPPPGGSIW